MISDDSDQPDGSLAVMAAMRGRKIHHLWTRSTIRSAFDSEMIYFLIRCRLLSRFIRDVTCHQCSWRDFAAVATEAEAKGASEFQSYRRDPATLPNLRLGSFNGTSPRAALLRRAFLALHIPVRLLRLAGLPLKSGHWADEWYRFLCDFCYWRGVRRAVSNRDLWRRLTQGPLILMYHAFGRPGELPSRYIVPARRFARQMIWLKWRRYRVLRMEDFLRDRHAHQLPPARSIVITVDDGYADNRTVAYPILRRYGLPATIFLVSDAIGTANRWDEDSVLSGRPLASWQAIVEMRSGGITYGAHTRTHPPLTVVTTSQAREEIEGSREEIESRLGMPVVSFSYPYGRYDSAIAGLVKEARFTGACTVHEGRNDPATPQLELRRTEIYGTDVFVRFILTLFWGGRPRTLERRRDR